MTGTASDSTGDHPAVADLNESERHRLLAASRRRATLEILDERRPPLDLEELARAIARREREATSVDEETVARVATSLYHNHLPKMDDCGVVDYDPDECRVGSGPSRRSE